MDGTYELSGLVMSIICVKKRRRDSLHVQMMLCFFGGRKGILSRENNSGGFWKEREGKKKFIIPFKPRVFMAKRTCSRYELIIQVPSSPSLA